MILHVIVLFFSLVDGQGFFSNSTTLEEEQPAYQSVSNDPITVAMPMHQLPSILASAPTPDWGLLSLAPAATGINPGANMATIASVAVSETVPPENPSCSQCSIYYEWANVFYWPATSSNTDCLTLLTSFATPTPLPDASLFESPSAYVVFPAVSAGNACTQVGEIYTSVTMSFAPGALSTIEGPNGPPKPFNFGDLPCPPPDVATGDSYFYNPQVNPGRQYAPMIAPPAGLWALDPAYQSCVTAVFQGIDPAMIIATAAGLTGPNLDPGPPRPHHSGKKRAAHAHTTPRLPTKTPEPVWAPLPP